MKRWYHVQAQQRIPSLSFWLCLLSFLVAFNGVSSAQAQQANDEQVETNTEEEEAEEEKARPTIDLGAFRMRENRPAANETAKVTFSLHLALPADTPEPIVEGLAKWKHRLRDQVIVALRKTETKDFLEPDLRVLRRNITIRVNRLLDTRLVDEVMFTEYAFSLR